MSKLVKVELRAPKYVWRIVATLVVGVAGFLGEIAVNVLQTSVGSSLAIKQVNGGNAEYAAVQIFNGMQWYTILGVVIALAVALIWVPYVVKLIRYLNAIESNES
jgi:hypothetical protein